VSERNLIQPDIALINYLKKNGGDTLKKCFQCATCSVVCSLSPENKAFPRKEMISAGWGQKENLLSDPDIWLCHGCTDCSTYCPRGAKPSEVLSAIRSYVVQHFAFPKFLGNALKQPKYLVPLLLFPALILFGILYVNLGGNFSQLNEGDIIFARFFPHGILEIFFIGGNVLIFSFAGVGLYRYWVYLTSHSPGIVTKGFFTVLFLSLVSILSHKKFNSCSTSSARYWGHIFIFYGFIGAMATAGLALGADIFFNLQAPIPLLHPIKILGNLSGISLLIGSSIIIIRRIKTGPDINSNTYSDWLLIIFVFGVAVTGILTESMRLTSTPFIAYNIYYVHLILIFFLLWYAPYSKLAHMFYRTVALVYLNLRDRKEKEVVFNSMKNNLQLNSVK
jgi:quinone-modifying oxidoreductase, subunit QmoC